MVRHRPKGDQMSYVYYFAEGYARSHWFVHTCFSSCFRNMGHFLGSMPTRFSGRAHKWSLTQFQISIISGLHAHSTFWGRGQLSVFFIIQGFSEKYSLRPTLDLLRYTRVFWQMQFEGNSRFTSLYKGCQANGVKVPIWHKPTSWTLRGNLVARRHVRHIFGSARFVKRKKALLLKSSGVSSCKSSQNLNSSRIQLAFYVVFFYAAEVKGFGRNRRKVQMVRIEVINFASLSMGVCISTSDEFWKPHQCMCRWLTSVIPHRYLMLVRYETYLRKQASADGIECCVTKAK